MKFKTEPKAKKTTRGNAAGRELMNGVREAFRAANTGDYSTLTVREVEISDPGAYGPREVKSLRESLGVRCRTPSDRRTAPTYPNAAAAADSF